MNMLAQTFKTREQARAEREQSAPDFRSMSDEELAQAIDRIEQERIVISEELDADWAEGGNRGSAWRVSAGRARAYRVAHLKLARDEEARRTPKKKATADIEATTAKAVAHAAALAAAQELAEAKTRAKEVTLAEHQARMALLREEKALRHAEAGAVWEKRQARRARMFLIAADRCMSADDRALIWDRAREMFPEAEEWRPL